MSDDTREFVASQLVRLELLPKPRFERRPIEVRFYEFHLAEVVACEPLSEELGCNAPTNFLPNFIVNFVDTLFWKRQGPQSPR
jgi:hypothetical protein